MFLRLFSHGKLESAVQIIIGLMVDDLRGGPQFQTYFPHLCQYSADWSQNLHEKTDCQYMIFPPYSRSIPLKLRPPQIPTNFFALFLYSSNQSLAPGKYLQINIQTITHSYFSNITHLAQLSHYIIFFDYSIIVSS